MGKDRAPEAEPAERPWTWGAEELWARARTHEGGLTVQEAARRLTVVESGPRRGAGASRPWGLLLAQFRSPIVLLLLTAAAASGFLGEKGDAFIILAIVLAGGLLGFWQEWGASGAFEKLLALVRAKATVLRDGRPVEVPIDGVVAGDVVLLDAGDVIPGDGRVVESKDLFVNEAALTGETFPVEKGPGVLPADTPHARRTNCLYLGASVVSGTARLLVLKVGRKTELGRVSESLRLRPPETEFERGVRRFGYLLLEVTLLLVLGIFAINVAMHRPVLEAFLFALAIAVGLTPQLLPAVVSVNLSHGARRMARSRVIVRRLSAIENFGSMDVLCSDKTGTLTEGAVRLHAALDVSGRAGGRVGRFAYLNASMQSGYTNPIDRAVVSGLACDVAGCRKLDEVPYDFVRKRLSVVAAVGDECFLITKGALANVLEVCTSAETDAGAVPLDSVRDRIDARFEALSDEGLRVLGLAVRAVGPTSTSRRAEESGMTFLGLLVFEDPLRPGIAETVGRLGSLGVEIKLVTGDNRKVALHVARQAGLAGTALLTGPELDAMSDEALVHRAGRTSVFAEVEPNQKERIILALKKAGRVVGYLGDGINDASALHAADVGVSAADAVDVAREAAEIVLLDRDLGVLERGVREGRAAFANTLKYVYMATSANFGNMFSMAAASAFLPFLPLLPKQVLLTNLLTDLPEMTIAADRVDSEMVDAPRRWDIGFIRRFMVVFGAVSSAFDLLTFAVLAGPLKAGAGEFRSAWFVESVVSASLVVLVVRTRRPFFRSRPGRGLVAATALVILLTLALPWLPSAALLGLAPLPPVYYLAVALIVGLYVLSAEAAKAAFYRLERRRRVPGRADVSRPAGPSPRARDGS